MEKDPKTVKKMLNFARTAQAIRKRSRVDSAGIAAISAQLGEVQASMQQQTAQSKEGIAEIALLTRHSAGPIATIGIDSTGGAQNMSYTPRYQHSTSQAHTKTQGPRQGNDHSISYAQRTLQCFCCGGRGHLKKDCRFRTARCNKCNNIGHLRRVCTASETPF